MARFPIRPQSPNPRVKIDEDNTLAVYGDLQYMYDYILKTGGVVGPQGPPGPQGPIGATGPAGAQGAQGATGPTGPQGIQGNAGPIGPAGLNWQGAWAATTSYVADDAVGYGGASYFCISPITGNVANTNPSVDTVHWALLAAQGAQGIQGPIGATGTAGAVGPQGPIGPTGPQGSQGLAGATGPQGAQGVPGPVGPAGLIWKGAWVATVGYSVNDAVGYGGASYFCIATVPGNPANSNPSLDTVHWALLAAQGAAGPQGPIGPTGPQGPQGPQGPAGSGSVIAGNAVYVSKSGNDSTGQLDNLGLSYLTITAALAAAPANYTIVVFPGDYELSAGLILKNNVHFCFLGVGTLTLAAGIKQYLFSDELSASAVNCTIYAPGWKFEGTGNTNTDLTLPVLKRGCSKGVLSLFKDSTVNLTVHTAISGDATIFLSGSQGTAVAPFFTYSGAIVPKLYMTAHTIRKTADFSGINDIATLIGAQFAQFTINATDIIQDAPFTDYDRGCIAFKFCELSVINADRIINYGEDGSAFYMFDSGVNDKSYLNASQVSSGDGWTIWTISSDSNPVDGFSKIYAKISRLDNKGDCAVVSGNTDLTIEGTSIYYDAMVTDGILNCENGGFLTAIGCNIIRSTTAVNGYDVFIGAPGSPPSTVYLVNTVYNRKKTIIPPGIPGAIYHWNGTDFVAYKEVNLTSAQINTLYTVPVELLPAPASGTTQYYVIDRIICEITKGTSGVISANNCVITDSYGAYYYIPSTFFSANENQYFTLAPSPVLNNPSDNKLLSPVGQLQNVPANRKVNLQMYLSNPTGITTQTMKVKIWYRLETAG